MSASRPEVSVLLAVHHGERYLRQALDSIFAQTFSDFEVIAVDDASTDADRDILQSYSDPRMRILTNTENLGLTRSLNRAAAASQAPFLARHDADDRSHPERLSRQVACLRSEPSVVLVGSGYDVIDAAGAVLDRSLPPLEDSAIRRRLAIGNAFCHGTVMMRRSAFLAAGGYRDAFSVTQDYDLWLRLAERGRLMGLEQVLYQFRFHPHSVSRQKRELQLSYGRLARRLAAERRDFGREGAIPADVRAELPADPARLIADFREAAVLHYMAGTTAVARESLLQILPLLESAGTPVETLHGWVVESAQRIARVKGTVAAGHMFMEWAAAVLHIDDLSVDLGRFYAEQAFRAAATDPARTWRYALRAVTADSSWLRDRGLWVIVLRSFSRRTRQAAAAILLA